MLDPEHQESMSLLFYDFNQNARSGGDKEGRDLMTDFNGDRGSVFEKRPTTSHFAGSDRLPSRQVKTRAGKRVSIASRRTKSRMQVTGATKPQIKHKNRNVHISASPNRKKPEFHRNLDQIRSKRKITTREVTTAQIQDQNQLQGVQKTRFGRLKNRNGILKRKKSPLLMKNEHGIRLIGAYDKVIVEEEDLAKEYDM